MEQLINKREGEGKRKGMKERKREGEEREEKEDERKEGRGRKMGNQLEKKSAIIWYKIYIQSLDGDINWENDILRGKFEAFRSNYA